VAERYRHALHPHAPKIRIVDRAPWTTSHAYHLFVIRVDPAIRDRAVEALQARGVGVGIHYPIPIHRQEGFQPLLHGGETFPASEQLASDVLSLPICGDITDAEVDTVIDELTRAV